MKTIRIVTISLLVVALIQSASANDRISLRSLGMGRNAVASTRGTDAIGINPANIAIPDVGYFNLSLVNTNVRLSTDLMTYDMYQKYFTGIDTGGSKRAPYPLTQQDKNDIRSQLPDNGMTRINIESMLAGVSLETALLGGIGFAVIDHAGINLAFTRDYFDMVFLEGLPSNAKYDFTGSSFEAWYYREYNFSYGRRLPVTIPSVKNLYAGVALKMVRGYGIFQTTKNNSSIENKTAITDTGKNSIVGNFDFLAQHAGVDFFNTITNDSLEHTFAFMPDPVGRGTGFDIGVTAEFLNGLTVGVSVTDIGKITWDKNVVITTGGGKVTYSGYSKEIIDSLKEQIKGNEQVGESFSTSLPTVFRIGAQAQSDKVSFLKFLPGRLLLAVEYAQGFNESMGNTTKSRFSLGAEYRIIPLLPLRTGMVIGGGDNVRWAFGFGLDFRVLTLDFATDNFGMFFSPKNFNVASFGFGLKIRV